MLFIEMWDGKVLRNIDHVWFIYVYISCIFCIIIVLAFLLLIFMLCYVLICRQLQGSTGSWWLIRLLCVR